MSSKNLAECTLAISFQRQMCSLMAGCVGVCNLHKSAYQWLPLLYSITFYGLLLRRRLLAPEGASSVVKTMVVVHGFQLSATRGRPGADGSIEGGRKGRRRRNCQLQQQIWKRKRRLLISRKWHSIRRKMTAGWSSMAR